jgi:Ca-activated chloride channel homolog
MHVTAHLDVDVIAVETEDEVSVLLELTAPTAAPAEPGAARPQRTLQVVLDRSGSMAGERLEGAKQALTALVDRLDPADNLGVVAFDDKVTLVVPAGPCPDKAATKASIGRVTAGDTTDLSAGFLRGIQEARRVAGPAGATLLLVSDGHANAGVTDADQLASVAAEAYRNGVVSSTLGWGDGYDERLLSAIARGGSGNEGHAVNADAAVALIANEVEGLLTQTAQAASLLIRPSEHVRAVSIVNELPTTAAGNAIIAELGSFYSGETRKLLLTLSVPALAALGLTEIATLELTYVELPALKQHTVTTALHVNVVPGDQAAGRVPDPVVRTEAVYQRVQRAKRTASRHLIAGDPDAALTEIEAAQSLVREQLAAGVPEQLAADLAEEAVELDHLGTSTRDGAHSYSSKFLSSSSTMKSRQRGRHSYNYNQPSHTGDPSTNVDSSTPSEPGAGPVDPDGQ